MEGKRVLVAAASLKSGRFATSRRLFIVARGDQALYERLGSEWAGDETVTVLHDRRQGERRGDAGWSGRDRREQDRRAGHEAESLLRTAGWVEIRVRQANEQ